MTGPFYSKPVSRRSVLLGGLGIAGALSLAACSSKGSSASSPSAAAQPTLMPKADGDLTWFSWDGYVDPKIVSEFESKYNVKVTITAFDSNDTMIQKLAAGLPYDLVTNNSGYMNASIQGGLLQPFNLQALTNYSQLLPQFQKPKYDNGAVQYSVPYSGGPTGIVYRTDKMNPPTQSYNDLWNNPASAKHIFVLDYEPDTIGAALIRKGYDINSGDPAQVKAAVDDLIALKPSLGGISSDTRTNVGNGTSWIQQAWVPDAFNVMSTSKYASQLNWEITTKEGVPFGMDLLTIGKNAKSPGTAMLFIDWMLSPTNLARTAQYTGQPSGTTAGDAAFQEVTKKYPAFALPAGFYDSALWREAASGARQTLWTQEWNRFKAA